MKAIGGVIKEARIRKKLSRDKLEKITKIKKEFIEAIESQEWGKLPEYAVVWGFVKNIAGTLKLNEKHTLALLRRDYPPKRTPINPKPDISEKFSWSPKLTFAVLVAMVTLSILGYLIYQYINFIQPPELTLEVPHEGALVKEKVVRVVGTTDPEAVVLVNNQPTVVAADGTFVSEIEIFQGTEEIVVIAKSRSGKESVIRRKIIPELSEP